MRDCGRIQILENLLVHRRHRCARDRRSRIRDRVVGVQADRNIAEYLHEIVIHQRANEVRFALQLASRRSGRDSADVPHLVENLVRAIDVRRTPATRYRSTVVIEGAELIAIDLAVRRGRAAVLCVVRRSGRRIPAAPRRSCSGSAARGTCPRPPHAPTSHPISRSRSVSVSFGFTSSGPLQPAAIASSNAGIRVRFLIAVDHPG